MELQLSEFENRLVEKINALHDAVSSKDWRSFAAQDFARSLGHSVAGLHELKKVFEDTDFYLKHTQKDSIDFSPLFLEFARTVGVLERNLELESRKSEMQTIVNELEKSGVPELYSSMQEKVLTILLRCRYFAERVSVAAKKDELPAFPGRQTSQHLLDLLKAKETELQEVKEKFESMRKKSFFGMVQEETSADLEAEIAAVGRRLGVQAKELETGFREFRKKVEAMQFEFTELERKASVLDESTDDFLVKQSDLMTLLKKERDYAKKVIVDIEHETMKLRSQYSSELIHLQESKLAAKREAEEKLSHTINSLIEEVKEKDELLRHFRGIVSEREKMLSESENKNKHLHAHFQAEKQKLEEKIESLREKRAGKKAKK
ncbi:MAG: hypothetical protein HY394_05065 [Candidatus Diapherotrites archaeon]|nr:hypothetical protein [Candidatus Diapherotrites archaeon]